MFKYLFVFIVLLSITSVSMVSASEDGSKQLSFVEVDNESDTNNVESEIKEVPYTGVFGAEELEVLCRKMTPGTPVRFKTRIVFQGVEDDKVEISSLATRCNADTDEAEAKVELKVNKSLWESIRDIVIGEDTVGVLRKDAKCRASDKVLTFYLKDDAKDIEFICGNPGTEDNLITVSDYNDGRYVEYESITPQYIVNPQYDQFQQSVTGYDGSYYDYNPYYEDYYDWREYDNFEEDLIDVTYGDWGYYNDDSNDKPDFAESSDDVSDSDAYGEPNSVIDFGQPMTSSDEDEYVDDYLFVDNVENDVDMTDPIGDLFDSVVFVSENASKEDSYWGILDERYSSLPVDSLASIDTYEEFKEYYNGSVTREDWVDWREWLFTYDDNLYIEVEGDFYQEGDVSIREHAWYNPWRWWQLLNGWLVEINPVAPGYDI